MENIPQSYPRNEQGQPVYQDSDEALAWLQFCSNEDLDWFYDRLLG